MVIALSESRTVPATPEQVFDLLRRVAPERVFRRRHGPIPPVREVRAGGGPFAEVGHSRTLVFADGGSVVETLTELTVPRILGYRLSDFTGPLKPLAGHVDGNWLVEPVGTGSRVTWSWELHPRGRVGALGLAVVARFWPGYARKGLAELEDVVLDS